MNGYARNELNAAFWSGGWLLGLAFLFSFFVTLLMLTPPMFMLLIYDRVLTSRSQESLVALFGLVVLLLVLMGLFDYSRRRILARFGARLQQRLEARVLEAVEARAPRGRQGGSTSGTKELDGLRSFFHSGSLVAVFDFIWAPIFLGAVFLFHPLLGWVAATGVAVLFATAGLRAAFSRHLAEDAEAASGQVGRVSRHIQDSRRTVVAQGMAAPMLEGWLAARRRSRDMAIVLNDRVGWFTTITRQLRLLFQAMTLALGAYLVLGGQLTVGGMVASVVLLGRVFRPVESFLANLPDVRRAASQWRSLDAILRSAPRRKGAEDIADLGGILRDPRPARPAPGRKGDAARGHRLLRPAGRGRPDHRQHGVGQIRPRPHPRRPAGGHVGDDHHRRPQHRTVRRRGDRAADRVSARGRRLLPRHDPRQHRALHAEPAKGGRRRGGEARRGAPDD